MKKFYFLLTFAGIGGGWQRSTKLHDCIKESRNPKKYTVYTCVLKPETPDEIVENLMKCYNVTDFGGLSFYTDDAGTLAEDQRQRDEFIIGWITEDIDLTKQL